MQRLNLGNDISGSLYDKVEWAVDFVVGAFNERLCKALEECGGRLDRMVDVITDFERVAQSRVITELSALTTIDSEAEAVRSVIDGVSKILDKKAELWGMELARYVHFVQSGTGVSDGDMLFLMFPGADEKTGSERLVAVYNGGGTVNLESP